jgi:hypothetical protein
MQNLKLERNMKMERELLRKEIERVADGITYLV